MPWQMLDGYNSYTSSYRPYNMGLLRRTISLNLSGYNKYDRTTYTRFFKGPLRNQIRDVCDRHTYPYNQWRTDVFLSVCGLKFLVFRYYKIWRWFDIPGTRPIDRYRKPSIPPAIDKYYGATDWNFQFSSNRTFLYNFLKKR